MPATNLIEVVKTDEQAEVINIAYVKTYLGIETSVHDTLLNSLIKSAREEFEKVSQVSVIERTVETIWSEAYTFVRLPLVPNRDIISVKDFDDTNLTLAIEYKVQGANEKRIIGNFSNGLKVTYTTGYGVDNTPEDIKLAITKNVVENFEMRTGIGATNAKLLPNNWRKTAIKYRPLWMF